MSMNRQERRRVQKRIAPIAKEIVRLELLAKEPEHKEKAEAEIEKIMLNLSMLEMIALEDYIYTHKLLNNGHNH